ncbi:TKL protein kinase [Phytophthora nicotianae P10297]|uniref:TKL protein kinase n=1 Tax=Phytophthora nicotianae P10297 TaxID=1317064 RepID=W2Y9M7_PHYNI|nr:TKL protein kinase [Phytophthora nicotianae P10297]
MGCTSSNMRRTASRLDKVEEAMPASPSMFSSLSDAPPILESPTSTTGYREMSGKLATPPAVQPPRRHLHRRRRREPHLDHHLTDRLDMLARYLQRASKMDYQEALHTQAQRSIDDLLDNIHSFFSAYEAEKRPMWRLAQTGRLVQQVESFHRTLDAITARCGLAVVAPGGAGPSLPRWQARWRRMRAERLVFFRSYLEDHAAASVSNSRVRETTDQVELLTLLKHDAQKFDTVLTTDELELLERTFTFVAGCCNNVMNLEPQLRLMPLPEWFVAPYERTKQQIKWQRAAVTVQRAPRSMTSQECFTLASTWSRLHHPHIMKLFGACHVSRRRFFVVAEGTPLTRCFGDDGFPLWRALHEAALALRYLHERRVGFDSLSCADLILFRSGDRDAVMLAGFNLKQMKSALESSSIFGSKRTQLEEDPLLEDDESEAGYNDVDIVHESQSRVRAKKNWQAPELVNRGAVGPTEASDVFALGMCVIEAFSDGNLWGNDTEVGKRTSNSELPPRPTALDAWQWALIERMCFVDPQSRPSLTEVLASFQVFAEDEEKSNSDLSSTKRRKKYRRHSLRQTLPRATSASIASALSEVHAWCDEAPESSALNYQLYERMDDIAARLEAMDADNAVSHLPVLAALILRFRSFLQRHINENSLLRLAATRQVIEMNAELHGELDVLMDRLRLNRSGASIHAWSSQQAVYRAQLWERMRLSLAMDTQTLNGELDGEEELSLLGALLAFEAKKRRTSYVDQDMEFLQTALARVEETYQHLMPGPTPGKSMLALPPWFVPPYEVLFNELDAFRRGSFGSIHFGKWMNLNVVVKKIHTPEDPGIVIPPRSRQGGKSDAKEPTEDVYQRFLNDMSAWSMLKHPNVLKLFGACHVSQHRFYLCEHAAQGTIDSFVASKPEKDRGSLARRILHDTALGLHYLHTQNIVHADLRCNNILVDAHGVVKLTDFGLSSLKKRNSSGATTNRDELGSRWMAPECLKGETPTLASNVYSFAMCAIEVVSGELPWGWEMTDAAVCSKVRKGLIPPRPANSFSDSEWALIERMCCFDLKERITMSEVVRMLT